MPSESKTAAKRMRRQRPIRSPNRLVLSGIDVQQLPPFGWCAACGAEIYSLDEDLCERCIVTSGPDMEDL